MSSFLDGLNPAQRQAVEHFYGPLLILAGAGTGKTRVITFRIAYLISQLGVSPRNILALTFTNKAAEEMKNRVVELAGGPASGVTLSTFHSFGNSILRRNITRFPGYTSDYTIYDETDSENCVKRVITNLGLAATGPFAPGRVRNTISRARNLTVEPAQLLDFNDPLATRIAEIDRLYSESLTLNNALDFDDLLLMPMRLFREHPDVLDYYKSRFKFVLVDEYQDTNLPQYEFLKMLVPPDGNITVVGDLDQSIYSWRGANPGNMLSFEDDFRSVHIVTLEQNYRSRQCILDAANSLITHNGGKYEKQLWSSLGQGVPPELHLVWDERQEAALIASQIDNLIGDGYLLDGIAIMVRTKAQTRVFEEVFLRSSIPYVLIGATAFYQRKEIKDAVSFLKVIENPRDFTAFSRIANEPKRGIGAKSLEKIGLLSVESGSVLDLIGDDSRPVSKDVPAKIIPLLSVLRKVRAARETTAVSDIIRTVITDTGYLEYIRKLRLTESIDREENLQELISHATRLEESGPLSLSDFLARTTLNDTAAATDEVSEGCVKLITLHSAKGLEFPVVFMAGVEEGILPHRQHEAEGESGLQEERRLCYVGITRARERLILTACRSRMVFGSVARNKVSRFIEEIGSSHIIIRTTSDNTFSAAPVSARGERSFFDDDDTMLQGPRSSDSFDDDDFDNRMAVRIVRKNRKTSARSTPDHDYEPIEFAIGDRVVHASYGEGCIVNFAGRKVRAAFPGFGVKTIDPSVEPLRRPRSY